MNEEIAAPYPKDETSAQLERVLAGRGLSVSGCARSFAGYVIISAEHMENVRALQAYGSISEAVFIHEKRESYAGLFAKEFCEMKIA